MNADDPNQIVEAQMRETQHGTVLDKVTDFDDAIVCVSSIVGGSQQLPTMGPDEVPLRLTTEEAQELDQHGGSASWPFGPSRTALASWLTIEVGMPEHSAERVAGALEREDIVSEDDLRDVLLNASPALAIAALKSCGLPIRDIMVILKHFEELQRDSDEDEC